MKLEASVLSILSYFFFKYQETWPVMTRRRLNTRAL